MISEGNMKPERGMMMKKRICLFLALVLLASCFLGCSDLNRQRIKLLLNRYIADSDVQMTSVYSETEEEGLSIYQKLFDPENKISIQIHLPKDEIAKLQLDYYNYRGMSSERKSEIYRKADLTVVIGSERYEIEEVGIRQKGNTSLSPFFDPNTGVPYLCGFKLSFDETFDDPEEYGADAKVWSTDSERKVRKKRTFASLEELDLKWNVCYDESFIREIYATKLFEKNDLLVQKINLSQLSLNGNNYGVYKLYEPIDRKFLEKRLPESALGGDLYKILWSEYSSDGARTGNWRGATYRLNNSYGIARNAEGIHFNFNLKTNKKTSAHESLIRFLNVINQDTLTREALESVLDVDAYARYMAVLYCCGDPDDIRHNYNNQYLYFRKDDGKAIFIVYDNDRTLGITYDMNYDCSVFDPYSDRSVLGGPQQNPLIRNTITTDALPELTYIRDRYSDALQALIESDLLASSEAFRRQYESAKARYEDDVTPYMTMANQKETFVFSLDGTQGGGAHTNMSFEQFRTGLLNTVEVAIP